MMDDDGERQPNAKSLTRFSAFTSAVVRAGGRRRANGPPLHDGFYDMITPLPTKPQSASPTQTSLRVRSTCSPTRQCCLTDDMNACSPLSCRSGMLGMEGKGRETCHANGQMVRWRYKKAGLHRLRPVRPTTTHHDTNPNSRQRRGRSNIMPILDCAMANTCDNKPRTTSHTYYECFLWSTDEPRKEAEGLEGRESEREAHANHTHIRDHASPQRRCARGAMET